MSIRTRMIWFLSSALILFSVTAYIAQRLIISSYPLEMEEAIGLAAIASTLIGFIFVIILLIYLQKNIITPISKLTDHTTSIRETRDLSLPSPIKRTDEIGVLSREIDHMVEQLQKLHSETHQKLKEEVSGHQKTEESLRRHREFLHQLFENSPFGIAVLDINNRFLNINKEFEQIFQYTLDELMGENIDDYITSDEKMKEATTLAARAQKGETVHLETIRKRKDNTPVDVLLHGVPIHLDQEQIGIYGIYLDITEKVENEKERNRLKDQLMDAKKMEAVGALAGGMAHEFNNLMAIILGNSEMLLNAGIEGRTLLKRLEAIQTSAERSATLTNQLLSFSRKQMFKLEILDINELIDSVGYMIKNAFGEGVKPVLNLDPGLPKIEGDQGQLTQVLMDLIQNACDAMPEKGELKIETENRLLDKTKSQSIPDSRPGRFVSISITDAGTGMTPETVKHIFDPFFTTKRIKNATGLGLSFVYGTIKQHQGWINVDSELGKGTTFKIYLPTIENGGE